MKCIIQTLIGDSTVGMFSLIADGAYSSKLRSMGVAWLGFNQSYELCSFGAVAVAASVTSSGAAEILAVANGLRALSSCMDSGQGVVNIYTDSGFVLDNGGTSGPPGLYRPLFTQVLGAAGHFKSTFFRYMEAHAGNYLHDSVDEMAYLAARGIKPSINMLPVYFQEAAAQLITASAKGLRPGYIVLPGARHALAA